MAKAKAKPAKRVAATKPRPKRPAMSESSTPARELDLEAAILEAPDDPLPRFVYGDWLQSQGARRGEWVTLSAAVEDDPKNPRLRAAAVAFLDDHRIELLGAGASLLPGAWIGWRCGFIDELRLQPYHDQRSVLRAFEALLAHPGCRFVRTLAIGALPRMQEIVDALARSAPPLLENLVLADDHSYAESAVLCDGLAAALPALRRLAVKNVRWTVPLPRVVDVHVALTAELEPWILTLPAVEELTLDCMKRRPPTGYLGEVLARLPALRRLRLLHAKQASELVAEIAPHAHRLELLDCSHGDLGDAGAARLLGARQLALLALRTAVSPGMAEQLGARLRSVAVSNPPAWSFHELRQDTDGMSWLSHRVVHEGRDALRLVPAAGRALYSLGTNHSIAGREREALPMLDAAITLPADYDTWAWANSAIAHARLGEFDDAELIAREGLVRNPREPNFFAIILHALRCVGRSGEAVKLVNRARTAIVHGDASRHTGGSVNACLAGVLYTLAQAGKHEDLLAFAGEHAALLDPNMHALIAMSHVALGRTRQAHAAFTRAGDTAKVTGITAQPRRRAVFDHAVAVFALARKPPARPTALAALARVKAAGYYDWHWIATDPNLAALHGNRTFAELLATPSASQDP
ncbi:MAG: TIGR02996 domain-containing protein [Kofleriaceae bacterium]